MMSSEVVTDNSSSVVNSDSSSMSSVVSLSVVLIEVLGNKSSLPVVSFNSDMTDVSNSDVLVAVFESDNSLVVGSVVSHSVSSSDNLHMRSSESLGVVGEVNLSVSGDLHSVRDDSVSSSEGLDEVLPDSLVVVSEVNLSVDSDSHVSPQRKLVSSLGVSDHGLESSSLGSAHVSLLHSESSEGQLVLSLSSSDDGSPGSLGLGVDSSGVSGGSAHEGSLGGSSEVEQLSESSLVHGLVLPAVSSDALQVQLVGLSESSLVAQVVGSVGPLVDVNESLLAVLPSSEGKHLDSLVVLLGSDNSLSPSVVSGSAESLVDVVGLSPLSSPSGH